MEIDHRRRELVEELQGITPNSGKIYQQAKEVFAGGAVGGSTNQNPWPIYMKSGSGCHLIDLDNNQYIDCCLGKGSLLLGHSHHKIIDALNDQNKKGIMHSAPFSSQVDFAEKLQKLFPCGEKIFLCNSGTEAVHKAIMIARSKTQRDWIAKFAGSLHGTYDQSCISVLATKTALEPTGSPYISGVPQRAVEETLILPFNDREAFDRLYQHKDKLAAVIVEPIATIGLFKMEKSFLAELQELCQQLGILLIFDEILTGIHVGMGGVQSHYGITPDIAAYGKTIGGGMPIGAVGCQQKILRHLLNAEPPLRLGGTFSGNPMSLAAGSAFLDILINSDEINIPELHSRCENFCEELNRRAKQNKLPVHVSQSGSMYFVHFTRDFPTNPQDVIHENMKKFDELCLRLKLLGVYTESGHTCFLSTLHTDDIMSDLLEKYWRAIFGCFVK